MEIRNLLTFVHVAERSSFTKAAKALNYSQSTVSFQIKQLETELGCPLFERINHTVTLTERGRELLDYAHKVSRLTAEFLQPQEGETAICGSFHITAADSICEDMMKTNYSDFHRRYPHIGLTFTNTDTETMTSLLDRNEADLMITLDSHLYRSDYVIVKEEPVPMHFVTGADSPYATRKSLFIRDILSCPFILTERGVGYRRVLEEELAKRSFEILPILEIGRTDIITAMLVEGVGVSFLPDFVTREAERAGRLIYLNVTDLHVDIW
ncbi:MAG: LysR family transcriptional regulator, partial [Clostridia bacterium]|nr:LysR family transcriptional regulator [Clostridia bacterium]